MPITSNSITHFTRKKEALKGILSDNFKLEYCHENIRLGGGRVSLRVPMVSFCDIPLSQIRDHIEKYGSYGIGLTRAWAVKNRLNPVIYIETGSNFATNLWSAFKFFIKNHNPANRTATMQLMDVFRHVKNYQETLVRGAKKYDNYRFADEREWRYVPEISEDHKMLYTDDAWKGKSNEARESISRLRLEFEPEDIRYIIIKSDDEISDFVDHLNKVKGGKFTKKVVERLTTRIITSEQIKTDF